MRIITTIQLLSAILLISPILNAQNKNGYTLNCQFEGMPNGTTVLLKTQSQDTLQSVKSKGNKVTFKGSLNPDGQFLFIWFEQSLTNKFTTAIFVSNKFINVKGTIGKRDVIVTGSKEHDDYDSILKMSRSLSIEYNTISNALNEFINSIPIDNSNGKAVNPTDQLKIDSFLVELNKMNIKKNEIFLSWIGQHKNSLYTPYLLMSMLTENTIIPLKNTFLALPPTTRNSYYGKEFEKELQYAEISLSLKKGKKFPNLKVADASGNEVNIQDVIKENKLTLIDCWASWCKPCRAAIPELKVLYEKYKGQGFNIVGISSDRDPNAWISAIEKDKTSWPHYIEIKDAPFSKILTIESIPSYILIDKNGNLMAFDASMSKIGSIGGSLHGDNLEKAIKNALSTY